GSAQSDPARAISVAELRAVQRGSRRDLVPPRKPMGDGQHRAAQAEGLSRLARGVQSATRRPSGRSWEGNAGFISLRSEPDRTRGIVTDGSAAAIVMVIKPEG